MTKAAELATKLVTQIKGAISKEEYPLLIKTLRHQLRDILSQERDAKIIIISEIAALERIMQELEESAQTTEIVSSIKPEPRPEPIGRQRRAQLNQQEHNIRLDTLRDGDRFKLNDIEFIKYDKITDTREEGYIGEGEFYFLCKTTDKGKLVYIANTQLVRVQ